MAHFAQIENNIVRQVIVVSNDDCDGGNYPESEPVGQAFIASLGLDGEWLQTSYSGGFRGKFAGIGDVYDAQTDVFDLSPEVKQAAVEAAAAAEAAAAKKSATLAALAAAAGLDSDDVAQALGV